MIDCNNSAWSADLALRACFVAALKNANVLGPIEVTADFGSPPYSYEIKIQIPSQSRTIVLTGSNLGLAPLTVTDSAGIITGVTGTLGSFTLDRLASQIYPQEKLTVMTTVTDSQGNTDTDMVNYV